MTASSVLQRLRGLPIERWLAHGAALCAGALFALSLGLNYGVDNQVAYLLKSLTLVNQDILHRDWFTFSTTQYHPVFAYLGALLIALNRDGWAVAYAQFAVVTAGMFLVWQLVRELAPRRLALPAFFLVLALLFQTRTSSVAVSYIFDFILQPSTLGSLFLLGAIWLFVRGRFIHSGVSLALSGAFHANYLLLGIATFGLAHLTLGKTELFKRLLRQVGPAFVVLLLLLPIVLATGADPNAEQAQNILFKIRSPHHYNPSGFERNFVPVAALQAIGLGASFYWFQRSDRYRRVGALLVGLMVLIWTGTLLTTRIYEPRVAQLFVWRFAPFLDLLCQVLACIGLVAFVSRPFTHKWPVLPVVLLVATGTVMTELFRPGKENRYSDLILAGAALALAAYLISLLFRQFRLARAMRWWSRLAPPLWFGMAGGVLFWSARPAVSAYRDRSNLIKVETGPTMDLYLWARNKSPKDAVFLTSPKLEDFRFTGQRAIVVDWKSAPIVPTQLVEWHQRLSDVVGRRVGSSRDLGGYDSLDQNRLDSLRQKYHLTHVVVGRGRENRLNGRVVYRNASYVVLQL